MGRAKWLGMVSVGVGLSVLGCSSGGGSEAPGSGGLGGAGAPSSGGSGNAGAQGAGGGTGAGGATSPGTGSRSLVTGDATHIKATIIEAAVQPGGEEHVCVVVALPNETAVWASQVHATLGAGSHHLIVDRRALGSALQPVPETCSPTMAGDDTRLVIAQEPETNVALPDGVAFKIEPHQPLFLQLHYFNGSADVRDIQGEVDLTLTDGAGAAPVEAHSLFTGSFSINLPPHSPGTSDYFVVPTPDAGTRHVFALTSHTHSLGVDSTIERVASATAPKSTPVHESTSWAEPPLTTFAPPLDFTGKDGLRLTCNYVNTTDQTVGFGTGFHDEMCFMWVYFFDK